MPKVLCWVVGGWGCRGVYSWKGRLGGFLEIVTLGIGVAMVFAHEREVFWKLLLLSLNYFWKFSWDLELGE